MTETTDDASTTRTLPFFLVALGFTWALQLPVVLAQHGLIPGGADRFMPLAALGGFGPFVAAVLFSRFAPGGVRALFRRLLIWRVGAVWYLVALGGFALIHVAGTAVYTLFGGSNSGWLYLPENSQHVAAMIVVPIAEETGWRGFALPRLQQRYGALKATLMLGVAWALWHTMMFLFVSTSPTVFLLSMLNILVGSVVFTWIFNHTRGSLLLAILAHVGAHLNNPSHAMPNLTPFVIYTVALGVVACALVLVDRRAWRAPHGLDRSPHLS